MRNWQIFLSLVWKEAWAQGMETVAYFPSLSLSPSFPCLRCFLCVWKPHKALVGCFCGTLWFRKAKGELFISFETFHTTWLVGLVKGERRVKKRKTRSSSKGLNDMQAQRDQIGWLLSGVREKNYISNLESSDNLAVLLLIRNDLFISHPLQWLQLCDLSGMSYSLETHVVCLLKGDSSCNQMLINRLI